MSWISTSGNQSIITVHASPRASRNAIQGLHGDALKIRLQAPPVEGKANEALLRFLSDTLAVPARQITLLTGATGRHKRVAVCGLPEAEIRARLLPGQGP